ncbi:MAG: hypothetical protein VKI83_11425 [Synechococcaceae cyanobacterium]|nr:hypothetical protein [Synechococcaceae cyanobacterium]
MTKTASVVLACATQVPARLFERSTLLGRSLQSFPEPLRPRLCLLAENRGEGAMGLAAFYNRVLDELRLDQSGFDQRSSEEAQDDAIVVFIHDDVYLHDWNLGIHLNRALSVFDVVGVVGSANVPFGQPGWWHGLDGEGMPRRNDAVIRSGSINHFDPVLVRPDLYGPSPLACDLLDGVFLAARLACLRARGVRFDPQFTFHCYDTDFCYTARASGLRLGTWPIPLTHGSGGGFDQAWVRAAQQLQAKLIPAAP